MTDKSGFEIEKKFLIKYIPDRLINYKKIHVVQGYLCCGPALRVRKYGDEYILSYKFRQNTENDVNVSKEVEMPLTEQAFKHLISKSDGNLIEKNRYLIPLYGDLVAELDVFCGYLEGLQFVEVEFKSEEEALNFKVPDWFEKDVTNDYRYKNSYLSGIFDVSELDNIIKGCWNEKSKIGLISGHCDGAEKGKRAVYREMREEVGIKKKKVYKIKKIETKIPLEFGKRKFFISFYATMLKNKKSFKNLNLQNSEVEEVLIVPMQEGFNLIRSNKTKFPYDGNEEIFEQIFEKVELFYQKYSEKKEEEVCVER